MAIPPPPPGPPGPPPPPIGGLKLGVNLGKSSGGGDTRSALLQSIQKGTKLKPTTTVDKSGPALAGRVADSNSSPTSGPNKTRPPPPLTNASNAHDTPKLGGIFEGMTSMPKLKPVGGRTITSRTSPPSESPSSTSSTSSPQNSHHQSQSNGAAVMDFNTELTKHLTLKKQKKQQQQQQSSPTSSESNSRINRGPPPQPPIKNASTCVTDNSAPAIGSQKQTISSSPTVPSNGTNITIAPNKSSLFGKTNSSSAIVNDASSSHNTSPISNSNNSNSTSKYSNSNNLSNSSTASVKIANNHGKPNHGKPNCAPKPPGIQQIIANAKNGINNTNNSSNTTNNGSNGSRQVVSRHHSMRSPRSPPITTATTAFPLSGTLRGPPPGFQSQDAINTTAIRTAPSVPISRPTVAPPRPPNIKPPPPPPTRSLSNTNLPTLLSISSANASGSVGSGVNSAATNFGGSASNVSTLNSISATNSGSASNLSLAKDRSPNVSSSNVAPPLPPHRTLQAPPPPVRQTSITPSINSSSSGAPPVPQRHSSMRNSNPSGQPAVIQQQTIVATATTTPNSRSVARFVVDLDAKFGHTFHNVTEFPSPSPFTNLAKSYPSRNMKTTETRKAKAPSPPSAKPTDSTSKANDKYYLQLNGDDDKLFTNETSYC